MTTPAGTFQPRLARLRTDSLAQQEDHLLGTIVEGSLGERAVFRHGLEACQQEQRPQMRVSEVGQLESFCFLKNQLARARSPVDEGEVENLIDLVDGVLPEETPNGCRLIGTRGPFHLRHFFTYFCSQHFKLRIEDVKGQDSGIAKVQRGRSERADLVWDG